MSGAYYRVFSRDTPEIQSDIKLNYCWTSRNGRLMLLQKCQFFKAHVPSLHPISDGVTGSLESVCFPGYFVRQKNYHYVLAKRDGSPTFGELCTNQAHRISIVTIQGFFLSRASRTNNCPRHVPHVQITAHDTCLTYK